MVGKKKKAATYPKKESKTQSSESIAIPSKKNRWSVFLPLMILSVISIGIYSASLDYDYVLDDKIVLSENDFVKSGWDGLSDIFTKESFTGYLGQQKDLVVGARYRPLSIATFAIEHAYFGLNPWVGHLGNIILYALTAMVLFLTLTHFFPERKKRWLFGLPFIAALLFVLHPLHTEVVANIKSRDEIMALLFALLSLNALLKYANNKKWYYLLLAPLLFFMALMSKENALTFLAVIPLSLFVFTDAKWKQIALMSTPLLISAAAFILIRYQVVGYLLDSGKEVTGLLNNPFLEATPGEKYATIFYTLGQYLKLLVYPHPLTHDYYPYHIPLMSWGDIKVLASLVIYIAMGVFAIKTIRKRSVTAWGILYFLFTLSIVSNLFFPIGTFMNERFVYMSSVGFVTILAYFLVVQLPKLLPKVKWAAMAGWAVVIVFLVGYAYKTIDRIPAWENEYELNLAASKVSVNSARANQFMGYSLYVKATEATTNPEKKELLDQATPYIDKALGIYPTYGEANNAKAGLLAGYYELDRNLDTLLDGFYVIQTRKPIPFVDIYLDYLEDRADRRKLNSFYRRLGSQLVQQGNRTKGSFYLKKMQ